MKTSIRTAQAGYFQDHQYLGLPYLPRANTTLNQKLNILSGVLWDPTIGGRPVYPSLRYACIGAGGHGYETGVDGRKKLGQALRDITCPAPFDMVPFVARPLDNDLTPAEQADLALRRVETHGNQQYACYYLRRLDLSETVVVQEKRRTTETGTTPVAWAPEASVLMNPTPVVLNPDGTNVLAGDTIVSSARLPFKFTAAQRQEFVDAITLLRGDPGYAVISEVGLCTGMDKLVNVVNGAASYNFNEAIGVQVMQFLSVFFPAHLTSEADLSADVGTNEPMLSLV